MNELQVDFRPTSSLHPHPCNPRTHSKDQIRRIAHSIEAFGFTNPILVDADGNVLAGHGRLKAAKLLGMDTLPTVRVRDMTEAQKRAYVIADNRLAELAGWDLELLTSELKYVTELDIEFDLTLTGFETPEIDVLFSAMPKAPPEEDPPPEPDFDSPAVSRPGDVWVLGRHRLFCGDALAPQSYDTLMHGERAEMVFTDPPYNVPIQGHVSGLGMTSHPDFAMASGEMSEEQFIAFLNTFMRHMTAHSVDGAIHYVCMDWRHVSEVLAAARGVYSEVKNLCVWNKANGGMGSCGNPAQKPHSCRPHVQTAASGMGSTAQTTRMLLTASSPNAPAEPPFVRPEIIARISSKGGKRRTSG